MKQYSDKEFKVASIIATFFNIGNIKWGPGTFGSLATFPLWLVLNFLILKLNLGSFMCAFSIYLVVFGIITYAGFWSANIYMSVNKKEDPCEVVIDEVAGQFLSFLIPTIFTTIYITYKPIDVTISGAYSFIMTMCLTILPIILFRFFDICKFGLVRYYDTKVKGAKGVMMDDIIAGMQSGIVCSIVIMLYLLTK